MTFLYQVIRKAVMRSHKLSSTMSPASCHSYEKMSQQLAGRIEESCQI